MAAGDNVAQDLIIAGYQPTGSSVSQDLIITGYQPAGSSVSQDLIIAGYTPPVVEAVGSDITGTVGVEATFDGSGSSGAGLFWTWTSVPVGSSIAGTVTPFPDNEASTPIDMTSNEVLYHFESPTPYVDSSGNGRSLTPTNVGSAAGKVGASALSYLGTNSQCLISSPPAVGSGDYSAAFWFYNLKPNSTYRTGLRTVQSGVQTHPLIVETGTDRLGLFSSAFRDSGATLPSASYAGWHHIAITVNNASNKQTFFVNGVNVGTVTGYSAGIAAIEAVGNWQGGNQVFADRIDEFALWSRELSADEILEIYLRQAGDFAGEGDTLAFTPDVAGSYVVQLTAVSGDWGSDALSLTATIAAAAGGGTGDNTQFLGRGILAGGTLRRKLAGHFIAGNED